MNKILIDRAVVEQALEALRCVDLQSLVPDYGSGHYSVARLDGPQVKSAITAMEAALAEPDSDSPERRCGGPGCDMRCCQPVQEPVGQLQEGTFGRGQVMWFKKPPDLSMLYTAIKQAEGDIT